MTKFYITVTIIWFIFALVMVPSVALTQVSQLAAAFVKADAKKDGRRIEELCRHFGSDGLLGDLVGNYCFSHSLRLREHGRRPLRGLTKVKWGDPNANRCVPDVRRQVGHLTESGEHIGFWMAFGHPGWHKGLWSYYHWQGIQRLSGSPNNIFVLTHDQKTEALLTIVQMGSRRSDGFRFGGNKLSTNEPDWKVAPPVRDFAFGPIILTNKANHPGGISLVGNKLLVPYAHFGRDKHAAIQIFEMADWRSPTNRGVLEYNLQKDAHFAAGTRFADGRYLLMGGFCESGDRCENERNFNLHFFLSIEAGSLSARSFSPNLGFFWNNRAARPKAQNTLPLQVSENASPRLIEYQNMNIVTECETGTLFLIGTSEDESRYRSWLHLMRLYVIPGDNPGQIADVEVTMVLQKRLRCQHELDELGCNLHAGGGVYIAPDGALILYGTEHRSDGPSGTVRMREFHSRIPKSLCAKEEDGWLELFKDEDFRGVHLLVELPERQMRHYTDLKTAYNFNEVASSVLFCLPTKWQVAFFENPNFQGERLLFSGTGRVTEIPSLKAFRRRSGNNFNDVVSSLLIQPRQ